MTKEKDIAVATNRVLVHGNAMRLVNNAIAYWFKEARLSTTGGSDIEHKNNCGQNSTIMRALTSKDGDLLSHFDQIDESRDEIGNTVLKYHLNNNHDLAANKAKFKGQLPPEHVFGLCPTFEKLSKQL